MQILWRIRDCFVACKIERVDVIIRYGCNMNSVKKTIAHTKALWTAHILFLVAAAALLLSLSRSAQKTRSFVYLHSLTACLLLNSFLFSFSLCILVVVVYLCSLRLVSHYQLEILARTHFVCFRTWYDLHVFFFSRVFAQHTDSHAYSQNAAIYILLKLATKW